MTSPGFFYDLSELFHVSGASFKYYGIARTVMEVGYELARSGAPVRFVVYSSGDGRFHEVVPRLDELSSNGLLDPGLPLAARPLKLRVRRPDAARLPAARMGDALHDGLVGMVGALNRRRWRAVGEAARPVDLNDEIVVSLARPKLMSDFLLRAEQRGERIRFWPLLHDFIPLHEGKDGALPGFAAKFLDDNRFVIERSDHVLTNSRFTLEELHRFVAAGELPAPPGATAVPLAHELRDAAEASPPADVPDRYVLMVGSAPGRKNLELVLAALRRLHEEGRPVPNLVLVGALRKRTAALLKTAEFAPIADRVTSCIDPPQPVLVALYRGADALLIPSFLEGWGLPLGEALWVGTPGIAADIPVLHEVGGELATYVDPRSVDAMAGALDRLDEDALAERRRTIRDGHASLRSWADVAADLVAAVRGGSPRARS